MSVTAEDLRTILTRPIAFHRPFATVGGSVGAGVFLSQLYYWNERSIDPDGWVYKSAAEWHEETMLTRRELDTVRKALRERGVIKEKLAGVPATIHYKIDWDNLFDALKEAAKTQREQNAQRRESQFGGKRQTEGQSNQSGGKRQSRLAENAKLDQPKPPNQSGGKRQTIIDQRLSETTPENTTTTPRAHACAKGIRPATEELKEVVVASSGVVLEEEEPSKEKSCPGKDHSPLEDAHWQHEQSEQQANPVTEEQQDALDTVQRIATEFGLNLAQRGQVHGCIEAKGLGYVEEKETLTRLQPRRNLSKFFLDALANDWQLPKSSVVEKPKKTIPYVEPEEWQGVLKRLYPDADHEAWRGWSYVPESLRDEVRREAYDNPALVTELKAEREAEDKRQKEKLDRLKQVWLSASDEQRKLWLSGMSEATREVWTPKAGRDPSMFFLSALEKVLASPESATMEAAA